MNLQLPVLETGALPVELHPYVSVKKPPSRVGRRLRRWALRRALGTPPAVGSDAVELAFIGPEGAGDQARQHVLRVLDGVPAAHRFLFRLRSASDGKGVTAPVATSFLMFRFPGVQFRDGVACPPVDTPRYWSWSCRSLLLRSGAPSGSGWSGPARRAGIAGRCRRVHPGHLRDARPVRRPPGTGHPAGCPHVSPGIDGGFPLRPARLRSRIRSHVSAAISSTRQRSAPPQSPGVVLRCRVRR